MSKNAVFAPPKAIRGGVPVCFPQFSNFGPLGQQHGFVRNKQWRLVESNEWSVTLVGRGGRRSQGGGRTRAAEGSGRARAGGWEGKASSLHGRVHARARTRLITHAKQVPVRASARPSCCTHALVSLRSMHACTHALSPHVACSRTAMTARSFRTTRTPSS